MLLRLAYLSVTNAFALLRLLLASDWDKDVEILDRTLIWNQRHLLHALREFEHFYNEHRPLRTLRATAPLRPLPEPITDPERIAHLDVRRRDRLGGSLHEYWHGCLTSTDE